MNSNTAARIRPLLPPVFALACLAAALVLVPAARAQPLHYPLAPKSAQVDTYHGTEVSDPYRWLEDANSWQTRAWIENQNLLTESYLARIPARKTIADRLTKLWNFEKFGVPHKQGGRYFFSKNDGLQNQDVIYTTNSLDAEPRVLIDPNQLSEDGTVALATYEMSHDGRLMAYAISRSGSDWREFKVRDVETGKDLDDHIEWAKFTSAAWTADNKGFFYSRYDAPAEGQQLQGTNYFQKVYYHRIGTPQSQDQLIYERKDHKDWGFYAITTEDGKYLILHVRVGTARVNGIFYKRLDQPDAPFVELLNAFDAAYYYIANEGSTFYFMTSADAPRNKVIAIDVTQPDKANWKTLIPEAPETLDEVTFVDHKFFASYLKDAHADVRIFSKAGAPQGRVDLPGIGAISGFAGKPDDTETFYGYQSFTTPFTIFRYDTRNGQSTVFRKPDVDFNPDNFVTKQEFYTSKDGTKVPMFITHRKGLKLNGANPTLLYGYGGFNISLTPRFSISNLIWMEMGGVYAQPSLRGGGEYGKAWHEAGTKLQKQNVFDDFIAAAEYLITNKYTRPNKLAIAGGSNGGLLVGACMTQRPELFGAALPAVGVMDMLRFHKFTIGWAWTSDYGSADNAEQFKALYEYSPLHNLKTGVAYPPTLVTTADHDDRVVPAHSFKFTARLQECHQGPNPVLIRIETKAGHGAGKPTAKIIQELADKYAFLVRTLTIDAP